MDQIDNTDQRKRYTKLNKKDRTKKSIYAEARCEARAILIRTKKFETLQTISASKGLKSLKI